MELYKEILALALSRGDIRITFSGEEPDLTKLVEGVCYQALQKINTIIEDDSLEDKACFMQIEQIISVFEELGSSGGDRHDFG